MNWLAIAIYCPTLHSTSVWPLGNMYSKEVIPTLLGETLNLATKSLSLTKARNDLERKPVMFVTCTARCGNAGSGGMVRKSFNDASNFACATRGTIAHVGTNLSC